LPCIEEKKAEVLILGGLKPGKTAAAKDCGVEGGPSVVAALVSGLEAIAPFSVVLEVVVLLVGDPGRGVGVVEEAESMAERGTRSEKGDSEGVLAQ
jgi:hypothetical protein